MVFRASITVDDKIINLGMYITQAQADDAERKALLEWNDMGWLEKKSFRIPSNTGTKKRSRQKSKSYQLLIVLED